jgi:hypothetical protein
VQHKITADGLRLPRLAHAHFSLPSHQRQFIMQWILVLLTLAAEADALSLPPHRRQQLTTRSCRSSLVKQLDASFESRNRSRRRGSARVDSSSSSLVYRRWRSRRFCTRLYNSNSPNNLEGCSTQLRSLALPRNKQGQPSQCRLLPPRKYTIVDCGGVYCNLTRPY